MDTKKRPIIIDTDPGIDDAVALAIALNHPNLEVRLITTVAGNVDVEKTTNNALKLVDFFGKKVPVAKGCNCPLLIQLEDCVASRMKVYPNTLFERRFCYLLHEKIRIHEVQESLSIP